MHNKQYVGTRPINAAYVTLFRMMMEGKVEDEENSENYHGKRKLRRNRKLCLELDKLICSDIRK